MYGLPCSYADGFEAGRAADARERAERAAEAAGSWLNSLANVVFWCGITYFCFEVTMAIGVMKGRDQCTVETLSSMVGKVKADKIEPAMTVRVK